jgi:GT2 family glycosyltransferase
LQPAQREITPVEYHLLIRRIQEIVKEAVRPGARVLVVSRGDPELLKLDDRVAWHFPRDEDGAYVGYHPASGEDAIDRLEALREQGAQYLLLPSVSFWWRDRYRELFEYLAQSARVVWDDEDCVIYRHGSQAGAIDVFGAVDDKALYVQGWLHDSGGPLRRLTVTSPGGEVTELLGNVFRYQHPDLAQLGHDVRGTYARDWSDFVVRFEVEQGSASSDDWTFELEDETGTVVELPSPPLVRDHAAVLEAILERLPEGAASDDRLMVDHVFPAVSRLQERARVLAKVGRAATYGGPVTSPEISIVVPVYSRIDLVEHQLAQFVYDPEVRSAELIYVLDSPALQEWLGGAAEELFDLYRVPFRAIALEQASGFAAATNAGAAAANGRLLLLMNSDVFPDRPGWLGKMKAFYESRERIGALGAKLVYEDGSLQHAGMYFEMVNEQPFIGVWSNMHYFKGFSRHLPAANLARPVPAVTAACLMIEKGLFLDFGGLSEVYVQGDFEDSDLCLRLLEAGRESWYLPEAELYHLEGQSYEDVRRAKQAVYNRWLHTRRRGEEIKAAMARYPASGANEP